MKNFEQINNFGQLFLTKLIEPSANSLAMEVKESFISPLNESITLGEVVLNNCNRICANEYGSGFTIIFTSYVAYQVLDEGYYNFDDNEEYVAGKYATFCIYSKSAYLDYILKQTFADEVFPGDLKHYALFCMDHIIHIISSVEPEIIPN